MNLSSSWAPGRRRFVSSLPFNVRYMSGGMSEWTRRGWPTVKPAP